MTNIIKNLAIKTLTLALVFAGPANASNDPVTADPKTGANFNRYYYANNNPYRYVDPDGRHVCATGSSKSDCSAFKESLKTAEVASSSNRLSSNQQAVIKKAVNFYGKDGDPSVVISFGQLPTGDANIKMNQNGAATVTFDLNRFTRTSQQDSTLALGKAVVHEGDHGSRIRSGEARNIPRLGLEIKGYAAQAYFQKGMNFMDYSTANGWTSWGGIDMKTIQGQAKLSVIASCGSLTGCD